MTLPDSPRRRAARYGIGEWFGADLIDLSPAKRKQLGRFSFLQDSDALTLPQAELKAFWRRSFDTRYVQGELAQPLCRFLSAIAPNSSCNKSGGVCSMRRYSLSENGEGSPVPGDKPATVCPLRFLENGTVFRWVAEKMLGTREPILVKEMPFLRKVQTNSEATPPADDEDSRRAGRIDWILVDPTSVGSSDLKWCALETQGLYFSGTNWKQEFKAFAENGDSIHFPKGQRRPDYRSNGPKRLAPQLSVKVPVLRAWGKKVAVVVDGYFFDQMAEIKPSFRTARTEQDRLDQAEVVWFVVNYDAKMQLTPGNVFYSDLDKSMEALNATEPIERGLFQRGLKTVLGDSTRHGSKVFRLTDA